MPEKSTIANAFNQQAFDFLKVEVETGLTFAKIAFSGEAGSEKRIRNQANALKAYQTVLRLRKRVQNMDRESPARYRMALTSCGRCCKSWVKHEQGLVSQGRADVAFQFLP